MRELSILVEERGKAEELQRSLKLTWIGDMQLFPLTSKVNTSDTKMLSYEIKRTGFTWRQSSYKVGGRKSPNNTKIAHSRTVCGSLTRKYIYSQATARQKVSPPLRRSSSAKWENKMPYPLWCSRHFGIPRSHLKAGRARDSTNVSLQPKAGLTLKQITRWEVQNNKTAFRQFRQETFKSASNEWTDKPSNVSTLKSEARYNLCKCLIVCLGMKQYSVQTGFIILRNKHDGHVCWCKPHQEGALGHFDC